MRFDGLNARLNVFFATAAFDDRTFVAGADYFTGGTEDFEADFVEVHAEVATDDGGAGEDGDVGEDVFSAVTEGWGFDGEGIEDAFEFVEDEDTERFAVDFLCDEDEVFFASGGHFFEDREEILDATDFFIGDEDGWFFVDGFLAGGVGDEE